MATAATGLACFIFRFLRRPRIERTLFIIEWILDTDMQRRAQIGLNKGEAHHA
nr:Tn3 family transposase [Klebsiella pneumoniae]